MKKKYTIGLGLLGAVILAAAAFLLINGTSDPAIEAGADPGEVAVIQEVSSVSSPPLEGSRAPDFTFSIGDEKRKLSDYRGEIVFLNFWASWCPPCREEMPAMQNIHEEYSDVTILAVNLMEEKTVVEDFMHDYELSFLGLLDRSGETGQKYRIQAIPTSFFIDREGIIQVKFTGAMTEDMIRQFIEEAKNPN